MNLSQHSPSPPAPVARILVIDDDHDMVDILRMVLEGAGHKVSAAHSAPAGLAMADAEHPDLLIVDVMMPEGTEGFHLVWKLRARTDAWAREVPIIMLTAVHQRSPLRFYPDRSDNTYAPGEYLEITDFLDKPVEPDQLLQVVARVLRRTRPGTQLSL